MEDAPIGSTSAVGPMTAHSGRVDVIGKEAVVSNSDIDRILRDAVSQGAVPHVVALAADPSGCIYQGAAGPMASGSPEPVGPGSLFRIASMTKIVTTIAVLQQVERGNLDLDEHVDAYLPRFADIGVLDGFDGDRPLVRPPARRATVRQLLTHTAGLGYWFWSAEVQRWQMVNGVVNPLASDQASYLSAPMVVDPGERFIYGIGVDWLGEVVEKTSGATLQDYFRQEIFQPLEMSSTMFAPDADARQGLVPIHLRTPDAGWIATDFDLQDPESWHSGGHGLYSTPNDFLRLQRALLAGGSLDGSAVLRKDTVDEMFSNQIGDLVFPAHIPTADPVVASSWNGPSGMKWGYGLLLTTDQEPGFRAPGSGGWAGLFNTYFWIDRKSKIAGAVYSQFCPFADPAMLAVSRNFENRLYRAMV
ncbi:serine hydrolase domain-containing protein [Streptomyces sp. NPDC051677]|uniref:serine hydrolase domain-containing protein n=1 Tax=Streptomyces sp. NPDC051677 TaxID=3365669 RepID=UPI0037CFD068